MADEKGKVFTDFMEWQKEKRKNIKIMFEIIEYLKSHEIYWEMDHMEGIPRITMVFKNCDNCPNFITEGCIWFYEDSMEVRVYYSELGADICKTSQNRSELYRLLNFLNARLWPRVSDGMGGTLYQSQHLLSPRFYVTEDDRYDITAAMMVSYTHFEMYALEIEDFITAALPGLMNVLSPFVFLVLVKNMTLDTAIDRVKSEIFWGREEVNVVEYIKNKNIEITFSVNESLYFKFKTLCRAKRTNPATVLKNAIKDYVEEREKNNEQREENYGDQHE